MENIFINYIKGRHTIDDTYDDQKVAEKEAERLAEELKTEVLTLRVTKISKSKAIMQLVKSYEDACKILDIEPMDEEVLINIGFTHAEISRRKLETITKALNEGWVPNWNNTDEYKHYPYFCIKYSSTGANAGLSYVSTSYEASTTAADIGSRLCFKTSALARYAGETFTELYTQILNS